MMSIFFSPSELAVVLMSSVPSVVNPCVHVSSLYRITGSTVSISVTQ